MQDDTIKKKDWRVRKELVTSEELKEESKKKKPIKEQTLPIDGKAYIQYRRNITSFRDLPSLVEKELVIRTRVENRCDWKDWKLADEPIKGYQSIIYYDPWDYRLQESLKKPTAGYNDHVQRLGLGVYEPDNYGNVERWRALCVGSNYNRYTDLKLVRWSRTNDGWALDAQTIWISQSWFKDLLLETGLGDAEEKLINEETKEYKYVITKNNFKLLQNQVAILDRENKSLKAKLVSFTNDIADIKLAMTKGGTK